MPAFSSFGSSLKVGALSAGGAYSAPTNTVGEIVSINLDGISLNTVDVSNISSRFKKFVAGQVDPGTISVEVNLDPDDASQQEIINQLAAWGTTATTATIVAKSFLVSFGNFAQSGNAAELQCVGFVTNFSVKTGIDQAVTASFQIKLTSQPTLVDIDA